MQKSFSDIIIAMTLGCLFLALVFYCLCGCSTDDAVSSNEMYQKCIEVSDTLDCSKSFTIYY